MEAVKNIDDVKFDLIMKLSESAFLKWCRDNPYPSKSGLSRDQVDTILYRLGMIQGRAYLKTGHLSSFSLR